LNPPFIKSAPTSPYVSDFVAKAHEYDVSLSVNPNTGAITPQGSTVPLTSNQIAEVATQLAEGRPATVGHPVITPLPLPINSLTPFIDPADYPWMVPGIDAVEGDFQNIYNPKGQTLATNFP
jgi:hypothetical protein